MSTVGNRCPVHLSARAVSGADKRSNSQFVSVKVIMEIEPRHTSISDIHPEWLSTWKSFRPMNTRLWLQQTLPLGLQ